MCPSELPIRHLAITNLRPLRRPAVLPAGCSKEQPARWGRRPQRPGNQSRLRAFSGISPGNSPSRIAGAAGSAASIRQAQELSRFAEPTLSQTVGSRNTKNLRPCAEPVEDETSLWKIEENQE